MKNVIHQIESKNEWLLHPATFTTKLAMVFVLTLKNERAQKEQFLLKNGSRDFQNRAPFERSTCFYVTVNENFKRFQYFNFETVFLENKKHFQ